MTLVFKIGSRQSELALRQSNLVVSGINNLLSLSSENVNHKSFEIIPMAVTGDIRRDSMNLNVQDKKQWVIELEQKIIAGEIDCAIHSAKDVPLMIENGTSIITVLPRNMSHDVLLYKEDSKPPCPNSPLPMLRPGATIGTSSKRRRSQLLKLRPDLCIKLFRGNITTRVEKFKSSNEFDAIVLAAAGLNRLDIAKELSWHIFSETEMVPAVGQGTLLAQYRSNDIVTRQLLESLSNKFTEAEYTAERSCIHFLGADCHSNLGVYAKIDKENINIHARVLSDDGQACIEASIDSQFHMNSESINHAISIGIELGKLLLDRGAGSLI
ncbi:MAG TPA: hydroxymethylbilane synthase [Oligoflexia bacterium]|nr:hydroxymethylbilane synthase [Oligoflexia bacterium]HMP47368.1 hydroxymethylbilane synthase [Oligoflexia bacterium]